MPSPHDTPTCSRQHCTPCRGGIPPLTRAEAAARLAELPGWELDEPATTLRRRYPFKNFVAALSFADRVGALAEAEGHHPVLTVGWGFCEVALTTHKIKGLPANDFILARLIAELKV